jgi:hypothetical protein
MHSDELGYMFVICQIAVQDYSKVTYGSDRNDSKFRNCRVPTNRNLVFSGLINNEFCNTIRLQGEDQSQVYVWRLTLRHDRE